MDTSNNEGVKLFSFVVKEVDRINSLLIENHQRIKELCPLGCELRKQEGGRVAYYPCGRDAKMRLQKFAGEKIRAYPELKDRCSVQSFLRPLEDQIVRRFIENKDQVNRDTVKDILKSAKNSALTKLTDRKYIFPVYAFAWEGCDFINLGKIQLLKSSGFFEMNEESIKKSIESGDSIFLLSRDYYKSYPWVAIIEIKNMEPELGRDRAHEILEQTINCLRLGISSFTEHFIGVAEESLLMEESCILEQDTKGEFHPSKRWKLVELPVGDQFMASMEKDYHLNLLISIVAKYHECPKLTPLEERLLEGLSWFGQGWKEKKLRSKLIKYVTCLEGLLLTGEKEGIAEKLAERVALIVEDNYEERKTLFDEVKRIYGARSQVVHGKGTSGEADKLYELCERLENISRMVISACAEIFLKLRTVEKPDETLNEMFTLYKLSGDRRDIHEYFAAFGGL